MPIKHVVASTILRNNKLFFKGDEIQFEDHEADHVAQLLANGALAGPVAEEREALRIYNEFQTKMKGMSKDQQIKLYRAYLRQTDEERKLREQREARTKTDANAALQANMAEAAPAEAPVEDEEAVRIARSKK